MRFLLFILLILILSTLGCSEVTITKDLTSYNTRLEKVDSLVAKNKYNKDYCILVDYSIPSGSARMFLIDLNNREIVGSYLVAHGRGSGEVNNKPVVFSNIVNSNCSSVGLAVIKSRAYSNHGIHIKYWVKGLESTNNNMEKRVVVLHSWAGIPDTPRRNRIGMSLGCFTIANNAMRTLDSLIKKQSNKNIVLYSFQ